MQTNRETALTGKIACTETRQYIGSPAFSLALALSESDIFHATDEAGVRSASTHKTVAILGYN